jgi:hypothetical protein
MMKSEANSSFPGVIEKSNMKTKPWRRLWHLLGGSFFPILAFFVPKEVLLITLRAMTGVFVAWEIARLNNTKVNKWMTSHLGVILKEEERFRPIGITVNRQGKWDTIGEKINGHLGTCSCSLKTVKYRHKKGASHDSRAIGQVLAG